MKHNDSEIVPEYQKLEYSDSHFRTEKQLISAKKINVPRIILKFVVSPPTSFEFWTVL